MIQTADRISSVEEYYFSRKLKEVELMRKAGANVINLGIGSPDLPPSEQTISKLVEESRLDHNHGYQSYIGIPELRTAFAMWYLKYFKVNLNPANEILPLIGSKEGIFHISMAFVNPGEEVLIPNPGYPTYESATRLVGGRVRHYNLNADSGWYPALHNLEKQDLSKVKLMWINYPHMPTGTRASQQVFNDIIAFGIRNNILICNDNPYSFILNDKPISLLAAHHAKQVGLELNSLSKSHNMAGWRVGVVAGHPEFISAILKVKSNMDSGMFRPLQLAAVEALNSPSSWYENINKNYMERRLIAFEIMKTLECSCNPDQTGMFVWAKIPSKYRDSTELADKLLDDAHVFITPGIIFGSNGKDYIRISLCSNKELLLESKNRIIEYLK
jgi:LL-diaminopimelate aminotransferase